MTLLITLVSFVFFDYVHYDSIKANDFRYFVPILKYSNGRGIKRQKIGKCSSAATSFKSFKNQHIQVDDLQ